MAPRPHILTVFGTRPEAIKMAPLVRAIEARHDRFEHTLCVTAQHRQMLDQVLSIFELEPEIDLDLMKPGQSLTGITIRILEGLQAVFEEKKPDLVLVHGDTTTTFAASLAAFYHQVPVGHVEAGLRTGDRHHPWPEEINRRLTDVLAELYFAPTEIARQNLLRENVAQEQIFLTGNTVIDALLWVRSRLRALDDEELPALFAQNVDESPLNDALIQALIERRNFKDPLQRPLVLLTGHRRENLGDGFQGIISAVRRLATAYPEALFVYPVHLNPRVQKPVYDALSGIENVALIPPLDYAPFVLLMDLSTLILTDSGGIQEEAPSLGKPVLVMRETTERPEALTAGTARLVGTDPDRIFAETSRLLDDRAAYDVMAQAQNPFGDGRASQKTVEAIEEFFALN